MGAALWLLQRPLPRAQRSYYVDLLPSAGQWSVVPRPSGPGLPDLSPGALRVRIDLHEQIVNSRTPALGISHTAKVSLDSFASPIDRDGALDALQSDRGTIASAAAAQWPHHALDRAIEARGAPVYTISWHGVGQTVVILLGLLGLFAIKAMGQVNESRA